MGEEKFVAANEFENLLSFFSGPTTTARGCKIGGNWERDILVARSNSNERCK